MGTVTDVARPTAKGEATRNRILEIAEAAILSKGFDATSIEEIVAGAEITRSGFFYHFSDKNLLARALIERYIEQDRVLLDGIFARAAELSDDPLQRLLIGLKLFAELMEDLPNGHPGCLVASYCYQDRLFDKEVRELNASAVLNWRKRFRQHLDRIAERYKPRMEIDLDDLADMLSVIADGGIILSKTIKDKHVLARQMLLYHDFIKAVFLGVP